MKKLKIEFAFPTVKNMKFLKMEFATVNQDTPNSLIDVFGLAE